MLSPSAPACASTSPPRSALRALLSASAPRGPLTLPRLAVHGIVNRTQNLLGTKSVLVSQGQALFLDLRVTGLFGTGAFWLRFSDNGGALGRTTTTKAFSVGPPRIIVKGT